MLRHTCNKPIRTDLLHDIDLSNLDWEDAKCFRAAASAGTLRAAAERLGVHHSTISRRIDNLEQTLRTRLIERTPDGYVPQIGLLPPGCLLRRG
ncbi:MAG: LysR family transcriptional regulator [Pseudomonadota bacterium]